MPEDQFVLMTMRHHQNGIEMTRVEGQKGLSAEVKALAATIRRSQERELEELKQHAAHGSATDPRHIRTRVVRQHPWRIRGGRSQAPDKTRGLTNLN